MKKTIQFHIYKGEKYYIAEGTDLSIVTQGKTLDILIKNIQEAVALHLDDEDIENYNIVSHPTILANFEIATA